MSVVSRVLLLPCVDPDAVETVRRDVELVSAWIPGIAGVAGWSEGGWEALQLAAEHPCAQICNLQGVSQLFDVSVMDTPGD